MKGKTRRKHARALIQDIYRLQIFNTKGDQRAKKLRLKLRKSNKGPKQLSAFPAFTETQLSNQRENWAGGTLIHVEPGLSL